MSDLLNSASLVMIPSGYKEDVVYSQIPTSGAGDLSFTRASNGTRINSAGLVEVCPWNLLQQSETFNNSYWFKRTGVTITADSTTAPNGTTTADTANYSTGDGYIYAELTLVPSTRYTISLYAKGGGTIQFNAFWGTGQSVGTIRTLTSDWQRLEFSFITGSTTSIGDFGFFVTATCNIWGAQLNIGSTAKPYFPTTDRLNVPRLTYQNGGGGCPRLLLEKQSTNLQVYSENSALWTQPADGLTVSYNTTETLDPSGNYGAEKVTANSGNRRMFEVVSNGVGAITASAFVKAGTGNLFKLFTTSGSIDTQFNLTTQTVTSVVGSGTITAMGNGWYRCTATGTTTLTTEVIQYVFPNTSSEYMYFWGAQFENSSYPTSYIPTTSSSATRVADACSKTGISSLIGQSQGTMFADFVFSRATDEYAYFSIQNASASSRVRVTYTRSSNTMQIDLVIAGAASIIYTFNPSDSQRYKIAVGYKSGDSVAYINGSQVGTQAATFTYTDLSSLNYNNPAASGTQPMTGKHNQTILFKTRLTNAELASLTTL
jgi:hypothetical protein